MSEMSLHGSRGVASSASLIEQLQSLLKQKEGELANSQVHTFTYTPVCFSGVTKFNDFTTFGRIVTTFLPPSLWEWEVI